MTRIVFAGALALAGAGLAYGNADSGKKPARAHRATAAQTLPKTMRAPDDEVAIDALFGKLREADSAEVAQPIAEAIWRIWLHSGSDTVDLLINRVQVLMNEREYDNAVELLDTVVEIAPHYAEGWNKRATAYFLKGDYNRSIADVRQVLALEPRHFGALSGLGTMMREIGDPTSALGAFRAALKVYPFLPGVRRAVKELADEVEGRKI